MWIGDRIVALLLAMCVLLDVGGRNYTIRDGGSCVDQDRAMVLVLTIRVG